MRHVRLQAVLILLLIPVANGHADHGRENNAKALNAQVMRLIAEYPEKGFGGYMWPAKPGTHGTTRDLFYRKTRIARAGDGTHCVGVTFEIMWRALATVPGAQTRLSHKQAKRLRYLWFVPQDGGMGPAEALPAYGLGKRISDWSQARPGDFIQLWNQDRTFGHSAIFVGWIRKGEGQIVGVTYWSSQPWTGGIGLSAFSIGNQPGDMDPDAVFIARLALQH